MAAAPPVLASSHVPETASITLLTEDDPPFNQIEPNGQVGGAATSVVREVFKRAGLPYSVTLEPWMRAYNSALLDNNTCVYSTIRTDARAHQFKWVGPLVETPWALFARPGSPGPIRSLSDVRAYTLGGYNGDAVAEYLSNHGYHVQLTSSDDLNVRKLAAGRIDFWATGKYHGQYLISQLQMPQLKPVLVFNSSFMYLACNNQMADGLIQQLNTIVHDLQGEGFMTQVHKLYLGD